MLRILKIIVEWHLKIGRHSHAFEVFKVYHIDLILILQHYGVFVEEVKVIVWAS